MTESGTSGSGRLRIGGWIPQPVAPAAVPGDDRPPGDETLADQPPVGQPPADQPPPVGDPDDEQAAWDRLAEAAHPVPAADEPDDDQGAYRGRRRRNSQPRRVGQLLRTITPRRAAVLALAAGVLLIGAGVVAGLLDSSPVADPAPTPTALHRGAASPAGAAGPGPGSPPDAAPAPSSSPTPTPTGSDRPVQVAAHEAEAGEPGSHGQVVAMDGASGGQVVRLSGNRNGTFIRFTDVVLAEPGPYELNIFYFCEQDRTGTVSVNNEQHLTVEFPSRGEGGTVGSVSVSISFTADTNTIWIGTPGGAPLSVDRIALSR